MKFYSLHVGDQSFKAGFKRCVYNNFEQQQDIPVV